MIVDIQRRIVDDMQSQLGSSSTLYSDNFIDAFDDRYPDTITTPTFLGVTAALNIPEEYEIAGRSAPTLMQYDVAVYIICRALTYDDGQDKLDKLVRRAMRAIWTSAERADAGQDTIINLSVNSEGIRERVTHVYLNSVEHTFRGDEKQYDHLGIISFRVRTEVTTVSSS